MQTLRLAQDVQLVGMPRVRLVVLFYRVWLSGLAAGGIVLQYGFYVTPLPAWASSWAGWWIAGIHIAQFLLLAGYAADVIVRSRRGTMPLPGVRMAWTDVGLFVLIAIGALLHVTSLAREGWHLVEACAVGLFFADLWRLNVGLSRKLANPGVLLPLSFIMLIALGAVLLKAPVAVPEHDSISWLDAVFTMTSSVCVTGLTVRNTAAHFTTFGQTIIAIFIELGGLGIILFGSMVALMMGQSLSLRENANLSQMLSDQPLSDTTRFVRFIVATAVVIQLIGAAAMFPLWHGDISLGRRVGLSLFHAVSAFCNAGFSITGDNLVDYRYSLLSQAIIGPLIVIGGIGFPVLDNLFGVARARWRRWRGRAVRAGTRAATLVRSRLTLHTKIVLTTTAALYLFGVIGITVSELAPYAYHYFLLGQTSNAPHLAPLTWQHVGGVLADASFMSISARTAGFNTIPMDQLHHASNFVLMTLMVAGGSPGGTAGGIKTTTLALLVLSIFSVLRQRRETEAFKRTISDGLVRQAATVITCYVTIMIAVTLLLLLAEPYPLEKLLFEAISAQGTVGLTLGVTAGLTSFGKGVIIAAMYLGRVGPLALMGALLFTRRAQRPYAYAHEDVALG